MAVAGRKPKPHLQAVREGNPGQRPLNEGVTFPPNTIPAPDWNEWFPGRAAEIRRCRETCEEMWTRIAPTLIRSAGLVNEQRESLIDYCVTYARIKQGERAISREGMTVETERGVVKNGWTAPLNQYRSHLRALIGELGLSPSAATRLGGKDASSGDEDPFD